MIRTDAFFRTFFVKAGAYGTAFVVSVDGAQLLVTAKHLFESGSARWMLSVFKGGKWESLSLSLVGLGAGEVDIAVFQCPAELQSNEFSLIPAQGDFALGQDVYFLGFPYKLYGNLGSFLDGLPCAFVKKGTLSFFDTRGRQELFIDAISNEGFSGGPVLFFPPSRPNEMRVAGVVSKFREEREAVVSGDGERTEMHVPYNTGILVAYGMKHVLEIARSTRV